MGNRLLENFNENEFQTFILVHRIKLKHLDPELLRIPQWRSQVALEKLVHRGIDLGYYLTIRVSVQQVVEKFSIRNKLTFTWLTPVELRCLPRSMNLFGHLTNKILSLLLLHGYISQFQPPNQMNYLSYTNLRLLQPGSCHDWLLLCTTYSS